MSARTGRAFLDGLRGPREIWIGDERVADVASHPAFAGAAHTMARLFDFQHAARDVCLGKHSNDHMYSFYFRNPSGWIWEYGFGARPATHQSEYYAEDIYGHQFEAGGFDMKVE